MKKLSCSKLIKSSLKQLLYFEHRKIIRPTTTAQIKGNKFAKKITTNLGLADELRGTIRKNDFILYFVLDGLKQNTGFEIKNVEGAYENWFLNSSILQSEIYFTLATQVKYLDTPSFRLKEGYEQCFIDLKENPITDFQLIFGKQTFKIETNKKATAHILKKAELFTKLCDLLQTDVDEAFFQAAKWDSTFKFKETKKFNKLFIK